VRAPVELLVLGGVLASSGGCAPLKGGADVGTTAETYYVAPSGSGSLCSQSAPCRQIADAVKLVRAGDTILVADGAYDAFEVAGLTGRVDAPITIQAQQGAANVSASPQLQDSITITNSFYVVVDGLNAGGALHAGVGVTCSNNVTIRNGAFDGNAHCGVSASFTADLEVSHNVMSAGARDGICVGGSSKRPAIAGNVVRDNGGAGITIDGEFGGSPATNDCAWLAAGGQLDGETTNAVVESNVIYSNGATQGGAGINLDGVASSIVRNNLLYENLAGGIASYQADGSSGPVGMEILGNTVVQAAGARQALELANTTGSNRIHDNIVCAPDTASPGFLFGAESDITSVDSDYNVVDRFTIGDPTSSAPLTTLDLPTFQSKYQRDLHSVGGATPARLFANAAAGDYSLASGSPAIGRGVYETDAPTDEAGKARPLTAPDIGALQH